MTCENCKYGIDYGESIEYIWCEKKVRRKSVRKTDYCNSYVKEDLEKVLRK